MTPEDDLLREALAYVQDTLPACCLGITNLDGTGQSCPGGHSRDNACCRARALATRLSAAHQPEPFAHFRWNDGWQVWEQAVDDAAGGPGVIAAYRLPPPAPTLDPEAVARVIREHLDSAGKDTFPMPADCTSDMWCGYLTYDGFDALVRTIIAMAPPAEAERVKHDYWRPGEPDCPRDIKAPNGELHTLRCRVCGQDSPRSDYCQGAG